ncbi:MAG TPA: hypothetical protein VJT31_31675 [Rugosimonospora sp.]|nr:hypothetical protein [Rugosimonospora sp.]
MLILAGTAAVLVLQAGGAAGDPPPAWEPDGDALGSITLYDMHGTVLTGGQLDTRPAAFYAVASGPGRTGDSKAQLKAFTPQNGVPPGSWSGDTLTGSTNYPVTAPGTPSPIAGTRLPVATGTTNDFSLADYIGEFPNTGTTVGYQGLYELRLYTSGPGQGQINKYYRVDISVTLLSAQPLAGTWSVAYPASSTAPPSAPATSAAPTTSAAPSTVPTPSPSPSPTQSPSPTTATTTTSPPATTSTTTPPTGTTSSPTRAGGTAAAASSGPPLVDVASDTASGSGTDSPEANPTGPIGGPLSLSSNVTNLTALAGLFAIFVTTALGALRRRRQREDDAYWYPGE